MPDEPNPSDLFFVDTNFQVLICRQCKCAVRPPQVVSHLISANHRIPRSGAQHIQSVVQEWDHIEEPPNIDRWPRAIDHPIPGLPVHQDGFLCLICQVYTCRKIKGLKRHWREEHNYRLQRTTGRPNPVQQQEIQDTRTHNGRRTQCQRVFTQGPGSHYIRVGPPLAEAAPEPVADIDSVDRLMQQVREYQRQDQQAHETVIQAGDLDEATPWLNRTGWVQYLQGTPREPLVQSMARPEDDAEGPEQAILVIWEAMARLAKVSQDIAKSCGHLLRIDIARTMKDESPHSPLLAYLNAAGIQKHVEPWQQILMFFARTQIHHDWQSPEYRFTPRQQRSWDIVWRHAQARPASPDPMDPDEPEPEPFELRPIEIALLEFCIDLLRQKIRNDEYGCALICATAVLGCGPFGWATPENFPPKISSIIKISRFLVLHKALRLDPQSVEIRRGFAGQNSQRWFPGDMVELDDEYIYEADEGYNSAPPSPSPMARSPQPSSPMLGRFTQEQRHHPQRTFPEWVKYMVDTFMVRGTNGPVQWLLDLRTYGMKVFFNTPAEGHIGWKSGDELLYKQIHFTMGDFRGFVHGLVGRMRQQLVEELMFCSETAPPVIPWEGLYDDPTQNAPGWSFIRDIRTRWPVDGDEWLIQRVRREPALRQRFVQPDGQGFRMHAIDRLFRVVSQFRERLAVAIHISAGQPSRGPELMSIRHRNSERERRNIFIEDRMVVFVSRYHKGFHVHNDTKVIFRYLPRELGELVVWYLWLVLPFIEQIQSYQRHFRGAPPAVSRRAEYIWSPDPDRETEWTGHRLREVLKRETALGLRGQRLHLQSYRDIAIAISRRYLRRSSQFQQNADDDQPGDGDVFDMDDEAAIDPDESMGFVADLQAGHSAHIAGMIYGRQMMEPTDSTMRHRQLFRQSSQDWHNFLAFRSIRERQEQPVTIGKRKRNPWEDEATEGRVERRYELQQCDMGEAFQHMMGADIPFRSIQAPVLQAIKHGVSPIVAVMPTGGGKSILFMLPAWVGSGGLTIVVVPLIALRGDMQQRCQQLGISCAVWDRRRPPDGASIVLVTPEGAENDEFIGFVSRQRMLQRLDRIVIDECHIVLNPNGRFRPLLQQLGKLRTAETQMILLTATLPPETEPTLFRRMGWERDQVALYRGRTCRHNVAYRVHTIPTDEGYDHPFQWVVMPSVVEFIRDRIRRACPGRVIIYGTVKAHITQLAEQLDCPAFHASQVDKDGILAWFRRTPGAVITATSALGMGIDIPDIRSVIHIGQPRTMLDYAQESGRAGRDGQPSEAIIIQAEGTMVGRETRPFWMQDEPAGEHPRVIEYIEAGASGCRRVVLDGYLDGEMDGYQRQRCGDQVEEAVCDGCQPEWQDHEPPFPEEIPGKVDAIDVTIRPDIEDTIPPGSPTAPSAKPPVPIAARHEFRQQDIQRAQFASRFPAASGHGFQDEEFLVEEVQRWVDRCWTCAQAGRDDGHELYRCFSGPAAERPVVEANRQWMKKIRGEIKYTGYTAHFWCGMPQDICPRANPKERNDEGTKQRCDGYRTALIPTLVMMVYGPYADPEVQERWFQRLGEQGVQNARENQAGLIGYLEQAAPNTAKKRTQLTEEFIWLRRAYQGREIGSI